MTQPPEQPLNEASSAGEAPLRALSAGELGPLGRHGNALPIFAMLDGVAVAVLSLADYKNMLAAVLTRPEAVAGIAARSGERRRPPEGLSTIERDPEVAEFIMSRFRGGVTIQQVQDCCRNTFGEERTPSRQRIQRFRERLRRVQ